MSAITLPDVYLLKILVQHVLYDVTSFKCTGPQGNNEQREGRYRADGD